MITLRILLVPIISCAVCMAGIAQEKPESFAQRMFGGAANKKHIEVASEVTACRLSLPEDPEKPGHPSRRLSTDIKSYQAGPAVPVSDKIVSEVRKLIFDPTIDDPSSAKGCLPNFGVRLVFTHNKRVLNVNFCFECDLLWISEGDKLVGGGDFDPAHKKLVALMKQIFPKAPQIQSLDKR